MFIGAGMLLWGIVAVRTRVLGRWSVLPLVMIGLIGLSGCVFMRPDLFALVEGSLVPPPFAACWMLFGVALLARRNDTSAFSAPPVAD